MKLIDTNVFIYAAGAPHEYRDPCSAILRQAEGRQIEACTNVEVLQEILYLYHGRRRLHFGLEAVRMIVRVFPGILAVSVQAMVVATDILSRYPHLQSRDAVHAAVVFEHRLEGIISADRGFDIIEGLTRFDPKELAA